MACLKLFEGIAIVRHVKHSEESSIPFVVSFFSGIENKYGNTIIDLNGKISIIPRNGKVKGVWIQ